MESWLGHMTNNNSIQQEIFFVQEIKKLSFMEQPLKGEFPVSYYDSINQGTTAQLHL